MGVTYSDLHVNAITLRCVENRMQRLCGKLKDLIHLKYLKGCGMWKKQKSQNDSRILA